MIEPAAPSPPPRPGRPGVASTWLWLVAGIALFAAGLAAAVSETRTWQARQAFMRGEAELTSADRAAGIEKLYVEDPTTWWQQRGFIEMVPALLPPTIASRRHAIRVFLKLPASGQLEGHVDDKNGGAPTVRFPPGTIADRVELFGATGATDAPLVVGDVRGAELLEGGRERFHVLRPTRPGAGAGLYGYAWPREAPEAGERAHRLIEGAMERWGSGFYRAAPESRWHRKARSFHKLGNCTACHVPARQALAQQKKGTPSRRTDLSGFYGVLSTLLSEGPLEQYRPVERNHRRPFVTVSCARGAPEKVIDDDKRQLRLECKGGEPPTARFDVAAALAAGDEHARAVCAARRVLWDRMDPAARDLFSESLQECGVSP